MRSTPRQFYFRQPSCLNCFWWKQMLLNTCLHVFNTNVMDSEVYNSIFPKKIKALKYFKITIIPFSNGKAMKRVLPWACPRRARIWVCVINEGNEKWRIYLSNLSISPLFTRILRQTWRILVTEEIFTQKFSNWGIFCDFH